MGAKPAGGKYADAALAILEGSIRAPVIAAKTLEQHTAAEANWMKLFKEKAEHFQSENFLVYGNLPGGTKLQDFAAALEKQYALARKALAR